MNLQELDVLQTLLTEKADNQRQIAELSRYSIGVVNRALGVLKNEGMIDDAYQPTKKARTSKNILSLTCSTRHSCSLCTHVALAMSSG